MFLNVEVLSMFNTVSAFSLSYLVYQSIGHSDINVEIVGFSPIFFSGWQLQLFSVSLSFFCFLLLWYTSFAKKVSKIKDDVYSE